MMPRRLIACLVLTGAVMAGGPAGVAVAGPSAVPAVSTPPQPRDLPGICGTLLGAGVSAASLGQHVAARGAGWIGAIIAAGCLVSDLNDYSREFNASPEGLAHIQAIKQKYGNYTLEDYMRDFDCTRVETRSGGYWNCSSYGD